MMPVGRASHKRTKTVSSTYLRHLRIVDCIDTEWWLPRAERREGTGSASNGLLSEGVEMFRNLIGVMVVQDSECAKKSLCRILQSGKLIFAVVSLS